MFVAYVAQGLPVGLFFYAIPSWLAANEIEPLIIGGFVGATALPWTLKFLNGFIMDRFAFLAMGKRRAWLIGAQTVMICGFVVGASMRPGLEDIALLTTLSFLINTATTFQDVAVDGLAVDLIPDHERPRANGLMFGGQSVGIAIGAALSGYLIANFGVSVAFVCIGSLVGATLLLALVARERPGERLLPWSPGQASSQARAQKANAWLPLLRTVWNSMLNRDSFLVGFTVMMNGVIFGLYLTVGPVIATGMGGWSDEEFSALTGLASVVAGLCGVFVFGFIVDRIGTRLGGTSGLIVYATVGLLMSVAVSVGIESWMIVALAFGAILCDIYIKVSTCSTAMRLCDVRVSATQFTLYMALANLGTTLSGFIAGPLDQLGGERALTIAVCCAGLLGAAAFSLVRLEPEPEPELAPLVD